MLNTHEGRCGPAGRERSTSMSLNLTRDTVSVTVVASGCLVVRSSPPPNIGLNRMPPGLSIRRSRKRLLSGQAAPHTMRS